MPGGVTYGTGVARRGVVWGCPVVIRGLYSAASGMLAAQAREGVVADNLANSQTVGYQALSTTVSTFGGKKVDLIPGAIGAVLVPAARQVGVLASGALLDATQLVFTPGPLRKSDNPLAAAIQGPGMFAVQTAAGVRYTRAGDFHLNASAQLVNAQGDPVLGKGGQPVQLPPGSGSVRLEGGGELMRAGKPVGQLAVFLPPTTQLLPVGQGLYQLAAGAGAAPALAVRLAPGFLEGANVDITAQMASLLQIQQVFAADASALQVADNTMRTAQNDVGTTA